MLVANVQEFNESVNFAGYIAQRDWGVFVGENGGGQRLRAETKWTGMLASRESAAFRWMREFCDQTIASSVPKGTSDSEVPPRAARMETSRYARSQAPAIIRRI